MGMDNGLMRLIIVFLIAVGAALIIEKIFLLRDASFFSLHAPDLKTQ